MTKYKDPGRKRTDAKEKAVAKLNVKRELEPLKIRLCEYCNKIVQEGEEHVAPEDSDDFNPTEVYNGICIVRRTGE